MKPADLVAHAERLEAAASENHTKPISGEQ